MGLFTISADGGEAKSPLYSTTPQELVAGIGELVSGRKMCPREDPPVSPVVAESTDGGTFAPSDAGPLESSGDAGLNGVDGG